MASNPNQKGAGPSRQISSTNPPGVVRSLVQEHGVSVATVTATLNWNPNFRISDHSGYLRAPNKEAGLLKALFKIPKGEDFRRIDAQHRALQEMLDQIRTTCKAWISIHDDPDPRYMIVLAEDKDHLREALNAIRRLVHLPDPDAERKEQGMVAYLTYPVDNPATFAVSIMPTSPGLFRAKAALVQGKSLSRGARAKLAADFVHEFEDIAVILRRVPEKMLMRVHLGQLALKQRPSTHNFDLQGYEDLLRRIRQRENADFCPTVGDGDFGKAMLELIRLCPEMFEPTEPTTLAVEETKPDYNLVVIVDDYHWETGVSPDYDGFRCTPGRVYRMSQRNRRAGINTFCPEKKLDWHLNLVTESDARTVPTALIKFIQTIRFAELESGAGVTGFPQPKFVKALAQEASVSELIGKTVYHYAIVDSPYILEVAIHHKWAPPNVKTQPERSCSVSILGRRWDQELTKTNTVLQERDWGQQFDCLFLEYEDKTGVESFLDMIDRIQKLIGTIVVVDS